MSKPATNEATRDESTSSSAKWLAAAETLLILLLYFVIAGDGVPGNDESHYLAKAKHYWDSSWCPTDHFLNSADAHLVLVWVFGWLTRWLPLTAVAWIGRIAAWWLLAWSWRRLSFALVPKPMFALISAALFLAISQRCQLAREWVVGGFEAKELAYAFVWLALEAVVRNKWSRAWLLLGAGSSFHVLVGGWSVLACGFAWLLAGKGRPSLKSQLPPLLGGLALALPGLVSAIALTWGVDRATVGEANEIYVYERLSHHLVAHGFETRRIAMHLILLVVWAGLAASIRGDERQRRLQSFVLGAVLIAGMGWLIDLSLISQPRLAAAVLRYYWFRLADASLPAGTALALIGIAQRQERPRPALAQWLLALLIVIAGVSIGAQYLVRRLDNRSGADKQSLPTRGELPEQTREKILADWLAACDWAARNTAADAIFLTPRRQQTFKWNAGRGEVFCWKDVPQDAAGLVEWRERRERIFPSSPPDSAEADFDLLVHSDESLAAICREYGATYFIVDRTRSRRRPGFVRVYPKPWEERATYEVYDVSRPIRVGS